MPDAHTEVTIDTDATETTVARIEMSEAEAAELREWLADERWSYELSPGAYEFAKFASEALGAMPMEEDS